jgi:FNIP Repeat
VSYNPSSLPLATILVQLIYLLATIFGNYNYFVLSCFWLLITYLFVSHLCYFRIPASVENITLAPKKVHIHSLQSISSCTSITHLTFGEKFDQPVDCLPSSLQYLTFGTAFNQHVDLLPPCLRQLSFPKDTSQFNKPVDFFPLLSHICLLVFISTNQLISFPLLSLIST